MEGTMITLNYVIKDVLELNLSYMPFINGGGLFIPTNESLSLNDMVAVNLQLVGKENQFQFEGKVVWIIPKNALHHVLPGVGVQFIGSNAKPIRNQTESQLNPSM